MKNKQRGFGVVETVLGLGIAALITIGTTMLTHQTMNVNAQTRSSIITTTQVENAVFWLSRDTQMSEVIITDDLPALRFIEFSWTELVLGGESVYHSVIYSFENLSGGAGDLIRTHWSSAGLNEVKLVARYINESASTAGYSSPVLTISVTSSFAGDTETRDFAVSRRPSFNW